MQLSLDSGINLGSGVVMPKLGLGTYKSPPGPEVENAVEFALRHGYRLIDTASLYDNEEGVGAGFRASGVAREDVFITTKVGNSEQGYQETLDAMDRSLKRLGTDYVDLYLVHWPMEATLKSTWQAMEELLSQGKTRSIGVCNFLPQHLQQLMEFAEVPPAVDQVEFHPWLQQPYLQTFLVEHGIVLEAWAPVMKGNVTDVPELVEIGKRYGKSPAQVAIRWILQMGYVAIPKSVNNTRIAENADVFDFELSDDEIAFIDTLDRGQRFGPDPDTYAW
jgi:methylglyoxal/glyoxal reductase